MDGEIGRFSFTTHSVLSSTDQSRYNTGHELFSGLKGKEYYRTTGFNDIAIIHGDTEKSYRKTALLINRIRHQPQNGTPPRTLHENTEKEGLKLQNHIAIKSKSILIENGFSEEGLCIEGKEEYHNDKPVVIPEKKVNDVVEKCCEHIDYSDEIRNNPVPYEDPDQSINISIDDVIVKKQEEIRPGGKKEERGKRKYIHNTIAHIGKSGLSYILNGHGINNVLLFFTAFMFNNELTGNRFQFFTDGHKTLNDAILKCFSWYKNIGIILDWFHLEKKCKEKLSLALKGRVIRNDILEKLKPLLWHGATDLAIAYLGDIANDSIKNAAALEKLIEYLKRNKPYIPCYAVRKGLGLCNSSAIGEKMNDLVVSERQKHNGMSWSKSGSVSLATITALKKNKENQQWFEEKEISFKMAA